MVSANSVGHGDCGASVIVMHLYVSLPPDAQDYLETCARIRNISKSSLMRRLLSTITNDQLVLSILDDDSQRARQKGEWRYDRSIEDP